MTHPAQFTPSIIDALDRLIPSSRTLRVFDPCAGLGQRLGLLADRRDWEFHGCDIEAWPNRDHRVSQYDARATPFPDAYFDLAITSVTYANGLADKGLNMADPRGRRTYDLFLGHPLHEANTGAYGLRQGVAAYQRYLSLHHEIFVELHRVLKHDARFYLNCSDVIKGGQVVPVTADIVTEATRCGFYPIHGEKVDTPRYGFGANADVRVDGEDIVVLQRT